MTSKNILFLAIIALLGFAQAANEKSATDPKIAEMMAAYEKAGKPGPEHEMLKGLTGQWTVTTTSWQSEGSKPEITTGTSNFKSLLGGRFLQQDFTGTFSGQPYEGTGMMGYNNLTKKYESSWYDSMSTAAMSFSGTYNASTKTISESGEFFCPVRKSQQKMRSELKLINKDNMSFTMYMPDMVTGKEFKAMEQVYKRKK